MAEYGEVGYSVRASIDHVALARGKEMLNAQPRGPYTLPNPTQRTTFAIPGPNSVKLLLFPFPSHKSES